MRASETCVRRRTRVSAVTAAAVALGLHGSAKALSPSVPAAPSSAPASTREVHTLLADRDVREALAHLWRSSGGGGLTMECAAWIVDSGGVPTLVLWTAATGSHRATWRGPVPPGAVALVHTHPHGDDPRPSPRDVAAARELRLPVTVVTRSALWTASPDGVVARDADASWPLSPPSGSTASASTR